MDLLHYIKASNTFLAVKNGELMSTIRSTDNLKDFGYLDESRKKAQMKRKGAVVCGCYRMCKPTHCAAEQDLMIQVKES